MASNSSSPAPRSAAGGWPEWMIREGAIWRPFEDSGVLVKAQRAPRKAAEIYAACEKTLVEHLKAVCTWPKAQRNQTWRVGDYSFYALQFSPAPETCVYVQFWSEPDQEGVIFEVSSGAWNPPADKYVDPAKQELLRDHGFEIGGGADNFRKVVAIGNAKDLRALAREALAILAKVLGYDGTVPLEYSLNLESRTKVGTSTSLSLDVLWRSWPSGACRCKLEETHSGSPFVTHEGGPGARDASCSVQAPRRCRGIPVPRHADLPRGAQGPGSPMGGGAQPTDVRPSGSVDGDGDLALESEIFLHGGVTADHLKQRLELFAETVRGM
jgi:hypothetical protein